MVVKSSRVTSELRLGTLTSLKAFFFEALQGVRIRGVAVSFASKFIFYHTFNRTAAKNGLDIFIDALDVKPIYRKLIGIHLSDLTSD